MQNELEEKKKEFDVVFSRNNISEDQLGIGNLNTSNLGSSRLGNSKLRQTSKFAVRKSLTNFMDFKNERKNCQDQIFNIDSNVPSFK